ncbi:MAG: hypothetical protein F4164_09270 [Gemmatimonadales bacterium]|nr:hypothetical protein [Gemmatimonadales bacterium]MYG49537.1 hypothetical protein [Gemmatimonadales bacterium]MYK02402.1 hypothetical protein [Candidatus Palauibacter ramosifaciens]
MIWILADTRSDAERLRRIVGGAAHIVDAAGELTADANGASCIIVGCRLRSLRERTELLRDLGLRRPWVPVILVTDRDADVARLLSNVRVTALVWLDDLQTQLPHRIQAARATTELAHLAEKIQSSSIRRALRSALVYAFRQAEGTPVRSVKQLASATRSSPATLSHEFRAQVGGELKLSGLLSGLATLKAQQLRRSGSSWSNVAASLGCDRRTLTRRSHRWPGCTLAELERWAPEQLLAAFVSEYVWPLLEE